MGLKSLVLLNKNGLKLFFNNSFLNVFNSNRWNFFFFFVSKLFFSFFNLFFVFNIVCNLKFKNIFLKRFDFNQNSIFFGKLHFIVYQKWLIVTLNSFVLKKKKYKKEYLNFIKILSNIKKKKIEL